MSGPDRPQNNPVQEKPPVQHEINPLWQRISFQTNGASAVNSGSDAGVSRIQVKAKSPDRPVLVQRLCTECDQEQQDEVTGIQSKLTIGAPNDPYEQEADAVADQVMRMHGRGVSVEEVNDSPQIQSKLLDRSLVQRMCAECNEELKNKGYPSIQSKSNSLVLQNSISSLVTNTINSPGSGVPLSNSVRLRVEPVLGVDLSTVRVHSGALAQAASHSLNARAFTNRNNIFLGRGQSENNVQLMAHEATHTVQQGGVDPVSSSSIQRTKLIQARSNFFRSHFVQRNPEDSGLNLSGGIENTSDLTENQQALVRALRAGNMLEVASLLENRTIQQLSELRSAAEVEGFVLEIWLARRRHFRYAETGLRNLWPALGMVEKMLVYDEGFREIEQAQIDVIRSFSQARRLAEQDDPRLEIILSNMSPTEEFEARILINPERRYQATEQLLTRAPGIVSDEEDSLFKAFAELPKVERRRFYREHLLALARLLDTVQLRLMHTMADGTEAQSLTAQLRLATEYRIDDSEGVNAVVDRMGSLLSEYRRIEAQLQDSDLSEQESRAARIRLREIGNIEGLLEFERRGADLQSGSMMARLSEAAGSSEQFGSWTASFESGLSENALRQFRFERARQQIILAGADYEAIESILLGIQAPLSTDVNEANLSIEQRQAEQHRANNILRQELLDDHQIRNVLGDFWGPAGGINRDVLLGLGEISEFDAVYRGEFVDAVRQYHWGQAFDVALRIAKNSNWRLTFNTRINNLALVSYRGEPRRIIEEIMLHQAVPLGRILRFTGDQDVLRPIVGQIDEPRRARLRLGYWISRQQIDVEAQTEVQMRALNEFNEFESDVLNSQTTLNTFVDQTGIQDIYDLVLGNAPTTTELSSVSGRQRAADIMFHRHQERNRLDRGVATGFIESDETMDAANREFVVLYNMLSEQGTMSATDFARLAALHQRFETRTNDFEQASNQISEMASVVVSTVAATLVVLATGGTAGPLVVAGLAAAAGAGSRVLAREMFGGDYYDPVSTEGGRDLMLGAIDGALAVVGSAVAAKGVQMIGLGGSALSSAAARAGVEAADIAAEQMTASLGRKVVVGGVEAAIDGVFSNTITESATALTDPQTWRRGVWQGIVKVGEAAVIGGLTGLGGGLIMGGALPIGGAAASRMWTAVAGDSVERIVADAGQRARMLLSRTRESIAQENFDQARRLLGELEEHLSPQQARRLREAIGMDGRMLTEGHNLVDSLTAHQRELLEQSGTIQNGADLPQEMLDNELDMVRRSRAQSTDEPGYIDEVDIGNNHKWRRREDGTWCRFSTTSLCGTTITGGPAPANASEAGMALWDDLSRQLTHGTADQIPPQFATAATKTEAPPGYGVQQYNSIEQLRSKTSGNFNTLPENVVVEIGGQHRIWREGDMVYHDSVIGGSTHRAGAEGDFYTAGEMGIDSLNGMHRGHVLGQGTGFESPFHISYIPREVNLHLQNDGVEELMRGLHNTARPGETFHVATATRRHPGTTRLNEISYRIEVSVDGGARTQLFEYRIVIGNDVPNPSIQHGFIGGTLDTDAAGQYLNRFDLGERVRTRRARWRTSGQNNSGEILHANNWDAVNTSEVVGRTPQGLLSEGTLNEHYVIYETSDGLWHIRRRVRNDVLYQRLTIAADNEGNQFVQIWRPW